MADEQRIAAIKWLHTKLSTNHSSEFMASRLTEFYLENGTNQVLRGKWQWILCLCVYVHAYMTFY